MNHDSPPFTDGDVDRALAQSRPIRSRSRRKFPAAPTGGQPPSSALPKDDVVLRMASEIESLPLRWLWPGKIPRDSLTLFSGDPDQGKSTVTNDIAARVSTGAAWPDTPDQPGEPGGVVILNAEDDPGRVIRPRLEAAGADLDRIALVEGVRRFADRVDWFSLAEDLPRLGEAFDRVRDCRLIIVDPIASYLGAVDGNDNGRVRAMLGPLSKFASERGATIILVTHNRKGMPGERAITRPMGSTGWVAASRAAWAFQADPNDSTKSRKLMLRLKSNLAQNARGMAYRLVAAANPEYARVEWLESLDQTADDALSSEPSGGSAVGEAVDFLTDLLGGGPKGAADVKQAAMRAGVTGRTLDRAKARLGIVPRKTGMAGGWEWALPEDRQGPPKAA